LTTVKETTGGTEWWGRNRPFIGLSSDANKQHVARIHFTREQQLTGSRKRYHNASLSAQPWRILVTLLALLSESYNNNSALRCCLSNEIYWILVSAFYEQGIHSFLVRSCSSSVNRVTIYWTTGVRCQAGAGNFSPRHRVQTRFWGPFPVS
jgi:hypothetical protein